MRDAASSEHSHHRAPVFNAAILYRCVAHNLEGSAFFVEQRELHLLVSVVVLDIERVVVATCKSEVVKDYSVFAHEEGNVVLCFD